MKIKLCCPHCGRRMGSTDASTFATSIIKRACPKCRTPWQITIELISARKDATVHRLTWVAL